MPRKLFLVIDPQDLDRYTKKKIPKTRKRPLEVVRKIDLLRRSLQLLPPRELYMLFAVKVLRVEQDEITELFHVRQSNISYRLERANYRIKLHSQISETCSETTLRKVLYAVGMNEFAVRAVLGVVKTSSQSATAEALGVTQGSVRHLFATAISRLRDESSKDVPNRDAALSLLLLIELNYNQLRSIKIQERWVWKVGSSNYPTPRKVEKPATRGRKKKA
jgi:DNA-directed RNA polymerase specialized sigma24 family protein